MFAAPSLSGSLELLLSRAPAVAPVKALTIERGDLSVTFRDNSDSPEVLSGADSLFNLRDAPTYDAFDPDSRGASAGLNYEHIISGHDDPHSRFAPRIGPYALFADAGGASVVLRRDAADCPWGLPSVARYTVVPPHYIDYEFRCRVTRPERFGRRGYALMFWANYMNEVQDVALHFRGVTGPGRTEEWVSADAPEGPKHWNGGGTYRALAAEQDLEYDDPHRLNLNHWSYDWPRITRPWFYGLAGQGMVYQVMFDRLWAPGEQIRFSLFKFKLKQGRKRPAWDFQYVITKLDAGHDHGFRARVVWKKFVSPDDGRREFESWNRDRTVAGAIPP